MPTSAARAPLIQLAVQFGHGTGSGAALRSAVDGGEPDPSAYQTLFEAHDRGSVLVAAVFDEFFSIYQARVQDLIRLATGGTGLLPEGALHPDLVNRASEEAADAADQILTVCLRAFDYMPVLDPDFGDFLRALVTADYELNPVDPHDRRAAIIESFRARGIYPSGVTSLAEDALLWPTVEDDVPRLPPEVTELVRPEIVALDRFTVDMPQEPGDIGERGARSPRPDIYAALRQYGFENAPAMGLEGKDISVSGFNPTFRVGEDGKLRTEIVVQWVDRIRSERRLGGLERSAGTTVVFTAEGQARYMIPKPWPHETLSPVLAIAAASRRNRMFAFVDECDDRVPDGPWSEPDEWAQRMLFRFGFGSLHRRLRFDR